MRHGGERPVVHVVTALRVEARPLVQAWGLEPVDATPFPLFEGELPDVDVAVRLAVSGVGRAQAAAATGWLAGRAGDDETPEQPGIWVGFGCAGARAFATRDGERAAVVGDVVLASRVLDEERRRALEDAQPHDPVVPDPALPAAVRRAASRVPSWTPPWLLRPERDSALFAAVRSTVRTVDAPETRYGLAGAYEMEAAGFVSAALRFATAELVQVVKVVSDTPERGLGALDARRIEECCAGAVEVVAELAAGLADLACELPPALPEKVDRQAERLGLSVTGARQWREQARRLLALVGEEAAIEAMDGVVGAPESRRRDPVATLRRRADEIALEAR